MLRFHNLPLLLAALLLCGCSSEVGTTTTNTDSLDPSAVNTATSDDAGSLPDVTGTKSLEESVDPTIEAPATDEIVDGDEVEPPALDTAEAISAAIDAKLQSGGTPDFDGAIELAEQGYAKLPDDENMIRGLTMLLYHSLQQETDETVVNQRRLRLGELARTLIERNQDNLQELGNMPGALLLEEAKAYLAEAKNDEAWASLLEAKKNGFNQSQILLLDPSFEAIAQSDESMAQIKGWLAEEMKAQIDEQKPFPLEFTLTSFEGVETSVADFKGKILLVDFWGTWCPPCRAAIPHLVELAESRSDDLSVLGINIENPRGESTFEEAKEKFDEFVKTQPINYQCLHGDTATVEQVPGFEGFPTMLLIDGEGTVRLKLTGYQPKEVLEAAIDYLVTKQAPS